MAAAGRGLRERECSRGAGRADLDASLALYRSLIDLRRREPALGVGRYEAVEAAGPILAYLRRHGERRLLIALNFGAEPATLHVPTEGGRILLSTHIERAGPIPAGGLRLRGDEGVIVELLPT